MTTPSDPIAAPVELWPVSKLVPYAHNAKVHTPESTKILAGVIKGTGHWTNPILVRGETGEIINGHGRRLAAIELGYTQVPVSVRWGLSDAEADLIRISDNKVVVQEFDTGKVRYSLEGLFSAGIDLGVTGYSVKECSFMAQDPGSFDEGAFVDDIAGAVEEQATENAKKAAAVDSDTTRAAEAFGFGKLTVAQGRRVKAFMAQVESETGLKGADALMGFFDSFGIK